MVDNGIKQTRIKKADLPAINIDVEGYTLRYRIISEDKNRTSHWSPLETIRPEYTYVSGAIEFNSSGNIITSVWDPVKINKDLVTIDTASEYDIWVRFDKNDSGDWFYKQRIQGNSITIVHPTTYKKNGIVQAQPPNKYSIEVYLVGTPVSRDSSLLRVYQDGPNTV
jgi:hypothetical protein